MAIATHSKKIKTLRLAHCLITHDSFYELSQFQLEEVIPPLLPPLLDSMLRSSPAELGQRTGSCKEPRR